MHSNHLVFLAALLSYSVVASASPAGTSKRASIDGPKRDNIRSCAGRLDVVWADPARAITEGPPGSIDSTGEFNPDLLKGSFYVRPLKTNEQFLEVWNIASTERRQPRCGVSFEGILGCQYLKNERDLMFEASTDGKYLSYWDIDTWTIIGSRGKQQLKSDRDGEYKLTCVRELDSVKLETGYTADGIFYEKSHF